MPLPPISGVGAGVNFDDPMNDPATASDTHAGPAPSTRAGWYAVTVLCCALILSFIDRLIISLVVDPIRSDLGLTDLDVSLLQGAGFAIIFALAGLPCGRLADRVNRRKMIAGGVLLWSAATIACGLATGFWTFFAARVALGLGEAALVPAASSLIIDLFPPRRRGIALGTFSVGLALGTGAAMAIGGLLLVWIEAGWFNAVPLIGVLAPWRQLMILVGLPGLTLIPLLLLMAEPERRHVSSLIPLSQVLRHLTADDGTVLRVCMVRGVGTIGNYALIAWLPTLLQRAYGMTPLEAGGSVGLAVTVGGVIAALVGGIVSDWFARCWGVQTRVVPLLGCYALTAGAAVTLLFAGTGDHVALALGLWALGSISGYVIGNVVMQESVPSEMRATTIALSLTVSALVGMCLGPTLVPLVVETGVGGEGALQFAIGSVSLAAALLSIAVVWPPVRKGMSTLLARGGTPAQLADGRRL